MSTDERPALSTDSTGSLALGEWHGCLTGDCPHDDLSQCVEDLREHVRGCVAEARAQLEGTRVEQLTRIIPAGEEPRELHFTPRGHVGWVSGTRRMPDHIAVIVAVSREVQVSHGQDVCLIIHDRPEGEP